MKLRSGTARLPSSLELPYVEWGDRDGIPVVFVHAYADSWRSFEELLPRLPPSIHAFAPTQRGHGDAGKPASGYAVEDFTCDLAAFLDAVGLECAVLVASSSAAFTVEQLAAVEPDRVVGLVLIGVPWSLAEVSAVQRFLRDISELADPVEENFVRSFVSGTGGDGVPADFLEVLVGESLKVPAHVWRSTLEGLVEAAPPHPGAITTPTLIIWGDQDAFVSHEDQERLRDAIPGSRLVVYEQVGHAVHWQDPGRVVSDIVSFVTAIEL